MPRESSCPTCHAMESPGMTVELAHCVGISFGVALAGDYPNDPLGAKASVEAQFCEEHASLIFGSARQIADILRRVVADA